MSWFDSHWALLHIKAIKGDEKDVGERGLSPFRPELLRYRPASSLLSRQDPRICTRESDSLGLRSGLGSCILANLSGDSDADSIGPHI